MATGKTKSTSARSFMTSRGAKYWSTGAIPLIAPDLLGDIISTASDIAIVISDLGHILSVLVNLDHDNFGKLSEWENRDIRDVLASESIPKLESQLTAFSQGQGSARPVELNHEDAANLSFPIRYTFHRIGPDGALLMLGRDLRPIAEMQQQLIEAQLTLERDYEHQREIGTRMRVLLETTRDAIVFVSLATGRVIELNGPAAQMMGGAVQDLINTPFSQQFEALGDGALLDTLATLAMSDTAQNVEMTTIRSKKTLSGSVTLFRAAGERMLICRLSALENARQSHNDHSLAVSQLFDLGSDGIVFTDRTGQILSANEAFLGMVDAVQISAVKGRLLADFLARGGVDQRVLTDNVLRSGHMRMYATRMKTEFGEEISVEISATQLTDPGYPGIAFVIRDSSRLDTVRGTGAVISDDGMRSARELVGSTTLKDIVSETTDVVEKMCIETAVELTGNNRVAAAEMLGLSRQSLYVKLRKYGLLARPD